MNHLSWLSIQNTSISFWGNIWDTDDIRRCFCTNCDNLTSFYHRLLQKDRNRWVIAVNLTRCGPFFNSNDQLGTAASKGWQVNIRIDWHLLDSCKHMVSINKPEKNSPMLSHSISPECPLRKPRSPLTNNESVNKILTICHGRSHKPHFPMGVSYSR